MADVHGRIVLLAAGGAEFSHEALGDDGAERGGEQVGFDAHVDQADDGAGGVVGVQRGEHEVAGEGGLDGDAGGFGVADFADHDDVGILPEQGAEGGGEGEADLLIDLELVDAGEVEFDGIFDGADVDVGLVEFRQSEA